jgi:hypothetical protein
MLQFLSDWLARDRDHLERSLESFVGSPAYGTRQLSDDLARFVFLLGGSYGERFRPPAGLGLHPGLRAAAPAGGQAIPGT